MAVSVLIQVRGDTAENWESRNTLLRDREIGYDKTNNRFKVGNSRDGWNSLPYVAPDVINDLITGGEDKALSAEQGRILKTLVDAKADSISINNQITAINTQVNKKLDADKVTHETWVFTLEDESTVDKEVMLWSL